MNYFFRSFSTTRDVAHISSHITSRAKLRTSRLVLLPLVSCRVALLRLASPPSLPFSRRSFSIPSFLPAPPLPCLPACLSGFRQDFTRILLESCQDFARISVRFRRILPGICQDFARILTESCQDFLDLSRNLLGFCQDYARILPGNDISWFLCGRCLGGIREAK